MFCPQDAAFGPTSTCRSFDFTLYFSNSILVILPSTLMVAACLIRIPLLFHKSDLGGAHKGQHDAVGAARAATHAINVVIAAALIGLTVSRPAIKQALEPQTIVPALVSAFLASILALPLTMLERRKTPRGAILLPLWLFATALFDACRLRTFSHVAEADRGAFLPLSAAALAIKVAMLALENTSGVQQHTSPESRASFFSQLTFIWLYPVIWKGYRKPLELEDLDDLADDFKSNQLHSLMQAAWKPNNGSSVKSWNLRGSHRKNSDEIEAVEMENRSSSAAGLTSDEDLDANQEPPRSLLKALFFALPAPLLAPVFPRLIMIACTLSQPFLVSKTLSFAQSYEGQDTAKEQPASYGWGLVGAYALVYTTLAFATGQYFWLSSKTMCKVRGGLMELIYHKSLKLHVESAKRTGGGAAANLMSVDLERLVKCIDPLHNLWSGLIIIVVGIYLLYLQIGLVFLSTVFAIILTLALPPVMSARLGERQKAWSGKTDERVNLLASAVKDAKGVKLSAYEDAISERLIEARDVEMTMMHRYLKRLTGVIVATNVTSEFMSLVTFSTLAIVDLTTGGPRRFTLNAVFSALTTIGILQNPLLSLGQQYAALLSAYASVKRIEEFLREKERPAREGTALSASASERATPAPSVASSDRKDRSPVEAAISSEREDGTVAAHLERTTIGWGDKAVLVNVDLRIPIGRLTMVCGRIASGKSTFLQALLGEADVISGSSHLPLVRKPVAYCAQDSWLMEAASVRDNIVFDDLWDVERYQTALHATALDVDVQQLSSHDRTAVSMLSGGQRQRVALARAIYSDADSYILDDVTSALDAETAAHVWRSTLGPQGLLTGKTVVFASNALELLHHADLIVRLEGGRIAEAGRFEELSVKGKGAISRASLESNDATGKARRRADAPTTDPREDDKGEEVETGTTPWSVYGLWIKAGGLKLVCISTFVTVINVAAVNGMPVWLQDWAKHNDRFPNTQTGMRIGIYAFIAMSCAVALTVSFYMQFIVINGRAGRRLHKDELRGVMGTSLHFFNSNPAGRIINRFSQDLFSIDWELAIAAFNLLATGLNLCGQIILMIVPAPYLLAVVALLSCFYVAMQRLYMPASRQLRRLEMSTKSPLYTLFAETSSETGLATIRALRREELFLRQHSARLDVSQRPYYTLWAVRRWLLTQLNLMGMTINVALVALVVLLRNNPSVGLLGVGLVQSTNLSQNLCHVLVQYTDFEILGVALERVKAFNDLPVEEGPRADGLKRIQLDPAKIEGSITVKNLTVAYTPDSEPALRDLSFTMRPGERLGVCGRSGSGKSTLLLALFRLIDFRSGSIEVDGQSIHALEVRSLRKSLSIVAQQPLLLAASVRDNLDPDHECKDDEIWDALEKIKLDVFVRSLPKGLQTMLLGSDVTLSAGQRQLFSLGRAILRKRRILILDEATSSMDHQTDADVQEILHTCFSDCTVIAVAHRLASIRAFDRILVLSNGVLAELDAPEALLKNTDGIFRSLCNEQGVQ